MRALFLLVLLTGCASSVHRVAPEDQTLRDLESRQLVVSLADGTMYRAHSLRVEADTTTWIDPKTGNLIGVNTARLAEVQEDDLATSLRGGRRGALIGAGVGLLFGAIAGNRLATADLFGLGPNEPTADERARSIGVVGLAGAAGGATTGFLMGVVFGTSPRYVLADSVASSR
ncbi:MAG: hypothetical protein Rubg2KO_23140 [Rubricoccaceae bacterium]